jgi:hypothetical protein
LLLGELVFVMGSWVLGERVVSMLNFELAIDRAPPVAAR